MLSDVYFPRINGVSTSIQTFAASLLEQGHRLTLIAPEYPSEIQSAFEIFRVPAKRLPFDPEDRLMSFKAIKRLMPRLQNLDIDVVHIQTPFVAHYAGIHLARSLGVKVVVSYHTFFEAYFEKYLPLIPKTWLRTVARRFSRKQCNEVDAVISPSSQMLEKLREYGVIRRASVISTGLPPKCFQVIADNNFRTEYGIAEEAFLLLYVGRVAYEKNIEFLIAMFRQVRAEIDQAILLVAGEGPALGDLRKRAKHSGVGEQIRFIGYLDRESALLECYQASDVFVFASQTETQGLVLLEAMASGLPVVSTASMGSLDVLTEGEGCLISPLEAEPFAARVVSLARDQDGRHELARRGIAYARGWGSTVKAEELIGFYEQTLQTEPQVGDVSNAGSTIEAEPNEP